ncbi:hypothetical protein GW17_00040831, partial [Ensete ventricosum]
HGCGRGKKKQRRPILLLQHLLLQQGVAIEARLRQREEETEEADAVAPADVDV